MERESAWKRYDEDQLAELEQLGASYIDFISENKTEREFAAAAAAPRPRATKVWTTLSPQVASLFQATRCGQPCAAKPSFWCSWALARSPRA